MQLVCYLVVIVRFVVTGHHVIGILSDGHRNGLQIDIKVNNDNMIDAHSSTEITS